jgi:hypothetical protein
MIRDSFGYRGFWFSYGMACRPDKDQIFVTNDGDPSDPGKMHSVSVLRTTEPDVDPYRLFALILEPKVLDRLPVLEGYLPFCAYDVRPDRLLD